MIIASITGGLFAFSIFIPEELTVFSALLKIVACLIIAFISFGYVDFLSFLKNLLFVLIINFIFAGVMLALWLFAAPLNMIYSNGSVYFDIDLLTILISITAAYFIIKLIRYIFDKNGTTDEKFCVVISYNGKNCSIPALADTANGLTDYFSGKPVIICQQELCKDILPVSVLNIIQEKSNDSFLNAKVRIIPFSTISDSGYVYAFKPDKITIKAEKQNKFFNVDALIGIYPQSSQEYGAIFNPKILL